MGIRVIIFTRQGSQLIDASRGELPSDSEANFRGVLSILEPVSQAESEYVFSIVPASTNDRLLAVNAIFAWAAGAAFTSILAGHDNTDEINSKVKSSFEAMIPADPLPAIRKAMESLLIAGVNYVSFLAQGHRVFLSVGDAKIPPNEFIFAWCAALEAVESIDDRGWAQVPDFNAVAVTQFAACLKAVVFFGDKATSARVDCFMAEMERVKQQLAGIFVARELKPQMPDVPKTGPSARRPGRP